MTKRSSDRSILATMLLTLALGAQAQGFLSESSGKRMPDEPAAAAAPAPGTTGPATEAGVTPVEPAATAPPEAAPAATAAAEGTTPPVSDTTAPVAGTTAPFGSTYIEAITAAPRAYESADRVLVKKSERRLYLLRSDRVIAEFPIKLGLNPYGPKQREGDFRTPEGEYRLIRRNSHSDFFLSLQVSYPSEADLERANGSGLRPGGLIMIHGQPNTPRKAPDYYANNDWTDGCIAVSNSNMVEIWLRTDVGTPIEIRP
jgi:murein L,D-transpeptidase YafK